MYADKAYLAKHIVLNVASQLDIRISDESGARDLSPSDLDIGDLRQLLSALEDALQPAGRQPSDGTISLSGVSEGSIRLHFAASAHIAAAGTALLLIAGTSWGVEPLPAKTVNGVERWQKLARRQKLRIEVSQDATPLISITPTTQFYRRTGDHVHQQTILYGEVIDIGGESPPKVKLRTTEYGVVSIKSDAELLTEPQENVLYQTRAVAVEGIWDPASGAWDKLRMLNWEPYERPTAKAFDEWLALRQPSGWAGVDADAVITSLRS